MFGLSVFECNALENWIIIIIIIIIAVVILSFSIVELEQIMHLYIKYNTP